MSATFTPAGSVTVPITSTAMSAAMPPVDSGNVDVTVQTAGAATSVWLIFAAGALPGPTTPGSLELRPGVPVLLTNKAGMFGGAPAVVSPGAPPPPRFDCGAGAATGCTVLGQMAGGAVTITRGTAAPTTTF